MRRLTSLLFLLMLISCDTLFPANTDTVSEAEAKDLIANHLKKEGGLLEIVEFKKTDGVKQEFAGQKMYQMSYNIKVRLTQDAYQWHGLKWHFKDPEWFKQFQFPNYAEYTLQKKGFDIKDAEKHTFKKTENGWQH